MDTTAHNHGRRSAARFERDRRLRADCERHRSCQTWPVEFSLLRRCSSIVFVLGLTLVSCGGDEDGDSAGSSTSAPTTGGNSSALQLRPVRATRSEPCATQPENPAGDQPVTLGGRDGACYDLGPAALTVRRAEAEIESLPDGTTVYLTLSPADTPAFGRILSENLYKQVAIVMFGRVQTAPTIQDPENAGMMAIAGLDPQAAENVVKALSG